MIRSWLALAAVVGSIGLLAGCSSSGVSVGVGVYGNPYGCYSCYGGYGGWGGGWGGYPYGGVGGGVVITGRPY
jgi:hypothetical protein